MSWPAGAAITNCYRLDGLKKTFIFHRCEGLISKMKVPTDIVFWGSLFIVSQLANVFLPYCHLAERARVGFYSREALIPSLGCFPHDLF